MIAAVERPAGSWAASAQARRARGARPPRAAFTLLEILICLALIALLIGATITMAPRSDMAMTTDQVFWKALTEARKQALTTQQDIRLGFDPKAKAFIIGANINPQASDNAGAQTGTNAGTETSTGGATQTFPVQFTGALTVDFLPATKSNGGILIGGDLIETNTMPFVTLYSDGTCTPFRLQVHSNGAARIIAVDPWTCAEVLEEKQP